MRRPRCGRRAPIAGVHYAEPGGRCLLWSQARVRAARRDRSGLAVRDFAGGFHGAGTARRGICGRGRRPPHPCDAAPRDHGQLRALPRHRDRALCRPLPALARPSAGGGGDHRLGCRPRRAGELAAAMRAAGLAVELDLSNQKINASVAGAYLDWNVERPATTLALIFWPRPRASPRPLRPHRGRHRDRTLRWSVPLWLAPVQVVATIVSDAESMRARWPRRCGRRAGLAVELDLSNQKINAKVREHSLAHVAGPGGGRTARGRAADRGAASSRRRCAGGAEARRSGAPACA